MCLVVCRDGQKGNEDVVFFYFSGWTEKIMRKSGGGESLKWNTSRACLLIFPEASRTS